MMMSHNNDVIIIRRVNEWRCPERKQIVKCSCNRQQVVIALTGGEVVYFEMDPTGQLNEYTG